MENQSINVAKPSRGGVRPGAGRPETDRNIPINVRISQIAYDIYKDIKNKSEYIDNLIKNEKQITGILPRHSNQA